MSAKDNYPRGQPQCQQSPMADYAPKERPCNGPLCMGQKTFVSKGPGNRICKRCAKKLGR